MRFIPVSNIRTLVSDARGAIAVFAALALVALMGTMAVAVDVNQGYDQRVDNQAAADVAALGAALAFKANPAEAILQPTAADIVTANGITGARVTATIVNDMPAAGQKSVKVTVETDVPFLFARALGRRGTFPVGASAYASLATQTVATAAPCLLALAGSGNAITVSGGASINTPGCDVAAVGSIQNSGNSITAKSIISGSGGVTNDWGSLRADIIRYATSFNNQPWNTNVPAADKIVKGATTLSDPLAGNATLEAARDELGDYTAPATLSNPSTPTGADWALNWSPAANVAGYRQGSSANYVIPAGNYTIGRLTIEGGLNVRFAAGSNITVSNGVVIGGGSTVTFGNVNLKVNGGFNSGSSGVTIGDGTIEIGSGTVTFSGTNVIGNGNVTINAPVTIGGGSSLTLGAGNHAFGALTINGWMKMGNGDLDVVSGISVSGGATLAAGDGAYRIGPNGSGTAINLSGSGVFIMGDGAFSANGNITTQGGSRLVFGKTTNHYINGNLQIAGSVLFGTSRYTIDGNFSNGTGGTTWPYTSSVTGKSYGQTLESVSVSGYDMAGVNVSFILSGTLSLGGGAKTKLIASTTTVSGGAIADLLLDSETSADTNWGAGAQNIFVGAVHLPNSSLSMSGGSTTLSSGQCFMLIVARINASGGTTTGSSCTSITSGGSSSSSGGTIGLVR